VIATRLEELDADLVERHVALTPADAAARGAAVVERLVALAAAVRARSAAHVLVATFAEPVRLAAGLADATLELPQRALVADLNRQLGARLPSVPGAYPLDVARLATEVGLRQWHDERLWQLGRIPLGAAAQLALGELVARTAAALLRPAHKVLVLDLDNTLWGGVLGEDGLGGIALGEEHPGRSYKQFQRAARGYADRGVLLAIASKNNEADVLEALAQHPDMVLRVTDFAARQIHWQDKATSLRAIAEELSVGLDALVFFDDNPVERAWVREQLPQVAVIEVPPKAIDYVAALDGAGLFDHLTLTAEDRARAALYQRDAQRRELAAGAGSVEDFLRQLDMTITVGPITDGERARVVQLLGKTNQFNLTTRRHTEADLQRLLDGGGIGLWMRVRDRFGDNGLVGVALAVPTEVAETWRLDTFLMSCRVLGRRAETTLLAQLARRIYARGGRALDGEFLPTKKNAPAAGFLAGHGFVAGAGAAGLARRALTATDGLTDELFTVEAL
jgi:FkbH-like protein